MIFSNETVLFTVRKIIPLFDSNIYVDLVITLWF